MTAPRSIPGTDRQSSPAKDGTRLERKYIYLKPSVWAVVHETARRSGQSVSQVIESSFANGGNAKFKEKSNGKSSPIRSN